MTKTAYEMRISDWSSDVCSSDLLHHVADRVEIEIIDDHAVGREVGQLGLDAAIEGAGEGAAHLGDRQSVDLRQATDVASEEGDVACAGADQRVEAGAGLGDADLRESPGGRDERVDLCRGIGRASCRERVCQEGWISVGAGSLKK